MSTARVAFVIDASVAIKVFLPEQHSAEATTLIGLASDPANEFHVPDLFYAECANIFWKQVQRGNASGFQVQADIVRLRALPLTATPTRGLIEDALKIALARTITAYDACYVALAQRLGVPLVTADQKLHGKLAGSPLAPIWLGVWTPPVPQIAVGS
jgi:predicted nucleic acid-binding protein